MDLCFLPQELVQAVASYLSLDDVLSCSSVNSHWRRVFNDDKIWFHLCSQRSPVAFDNFRYIEEPCTVTPGFRFLDGGCPSLPPVCKWRRRLMQEAHLTRNWRHGRHSKHLIIDYSEDSRDEFNFSNIQCEGDIAVVPYSERREFYVYSTGHDPSLLSIHNYALPDRVDQFFSLCNKKLVVVQCTLLQVYDFSTEEVELSHLFLFDRSRKDCSDVPDTDVCSWYNKNVGLYPCDISVVAEHDGRYFIGAVYDTVPFKNPHFHVWNIVTGDKAAVKYLPHTGRSVSYLTFSVFNSDLFILVSYVQDSHNSVYRFDLNELEFHSKALSFDYRVPYLLFSDKFILNVDKSFKNIYVWDRCTMEMVHRIGCQHSLNPVTLVVARDKLIYAENQDLSSVVRLVPLSDPSRTCEVKLSFNIKNVSLARDGMILVEIGSSILLVDVASASILTVLEYQDCLWSNTTSSKAITKGCEGLYLLSFW